MARGRNWTAEEKRIVLDNPDLPESVLAEKIGRTATAVRDFRHKAKFSDGSGRLNAQGQEYDRRPSGWYGEVIGAPLMQYKPAWESWLHYHRYVDYEVTGIDRLGWVTLICLRDADAP